MQRYFIKNNQINQNKALLSGNDFHHIKNVMRHKINDQIIICNEDAVCHKGTISEYIDKQVVVDLGEQLVNRIRGFNVRIAQSLIRRERFELMLQKSTELGVSTIIPIITKNTIIKFKKDKEQAKLERWNQITKEASEQSHRATRSTVHNVISLRDLDVTDYDLVLVAYEKEKQSSKLKNILQKEYKNILIVIGPEGGFDSSEIEYLESKGVEFVGLGPRILRSETASSYILSVLSYVYEMSDAS